MRAGGGVPVASAVVTGPAAGGGYARTVGVRVGTGGRTPMTVPPNPATGDSAADPTFGGSALDPATPVPYDAPHGPGHAAGREGAYPAPGEELGPHGTFDTYATYDAYGTSSPPSTHDPGNPYDHAASEDVAVTSGFGFPVPRPAAEHAAAYGTHDPHGFSDQAASEDVAVTSGFGFPVPRPAAEPAPELGFVPPEAPFAAPEFAAGTGGGIAEPFAVPPAPGTPPADPGFPGAAPASASAVGSPPAAPEFATAPEFTAHDTAGFAAVPPPPSPAGHAHAPALPIGGPADLPAAHQPFPAEESPGGPVVSYTIKVNGATHVVDRAWLGENLLQVLRERLGLPGAKDGCGQGVCGTCTVLLDGAPAVACLVPAAAVGERAVTTIEGVSVQGGPAAVIQQALIEHGAVQCGFCVPGIVMSAHALLARLPGADEATIRRALAGHPCRCVGPNRMVAAVSAVAATQAAEPAASLFEPTDAPESHA